MLTIIGVAAAAYLAWSYVRPAIPAAASVSQQPGPSPTQPMDRETAACMCCDLADYFELLGDSDAVEKVGELSQRIIVGDRMTGGMTDAATS